MHWTGNGRIEVSRNFALGVAAVVIALALAAMFLIGMVIGQDGDGGTPSRNRPHTQRHGRRAGDGNGHGDRPGPPTNRRKRRRRRDPKPGRRRSTPPAWSGPTGPCSWTWKTPGSPPGPTTATTVRCGT